MFGQGRLSRPEVAVIQVRSGGDLRPDTEGAVRRCDSESGAQIDLLADRNALESYHEAQEDFLKQIRENCSGREAPYLLLDGSESFEDCFLPLLSRSGMIG